MASKNNGDAVEKNTFSCGVVPDALGINVAINTKEKAKLRRPKKETVLTKHKVIHSLTHLIIFYYSLICDRNGYTIYKRKKIA